MAEPSRSQRSGEDQAPPPPELDAPTAPLPRGRRGRQTESPSVLRLFGSAAFFRLWLAQVVSSLGDWIGFVAITAIAARVGGESPEGAISLVLLARLVPGFFLGPAAGVFVDRWDRKRVMVICDAGRGAVLATLPFADTVAALVFASFLLEVMTLLWQPAKEATVPNLVRPEFLANANSLSLVAAYGTFPIGSALFALLAGLAGWLGRYDALESLRVSRESVAIWFDVGTFLASAVMISTLAFPARRRRGDGDDSIELKSTFTELVDGLRCIRQSALIRAVMLGIATGLIGGGMLVPLGPVMSETVFRSGTAGFGLLLTALGTGVAAGIITLSVLQKRLPHERIFVVSVVGAGLFQLVAASMSVLTPALVLVALLGLCAGSVYILGFTILQSNVGDDLRGRIFATLYTLVRFCLVLSFTLAPLLSRLLDRPPERVFDRSLSVGDLSIQLPGVRLTLWLGGAIIVVAGLLAGRTLRARSAA